jgi:hypothetical protein
MIVGGIVHNALLLSFFKPHNPRKSPARVAYRAPRDARRIGRRWLRENG